MSNPGELAARLIEAAGNGAGIEALTTTAGDLDVDTPYQVQDAVVADRTRCHGSAIVGAKLGLTSVATQRQMTAEEPLYGWLPGDMAIDVGQPLPCSLLI